MWCNPCQALGPILEEVAKEVKNKVEIGKINIDENPDLANMFGIRSIPTLILFKNGEPVEQLIGVKTKSDYLDLIEKHTRE